MHIHDVMILEMIESAGLKAGDEVKVHLHGVVVEMLKGGTKGTPRNPLAYRRVTRNTDAVVTVSGPNTYREILAEQGAVPAGKQPWFTWVRDGVVSHRTTNGDYFACVPTGPASSEFFVDGRPATSEEVATIHRYRKSSGTPTMMVFKEENVAAITKA